MHKKFMRKKEKMRREKSRLEGEGEDHNYPKKRKERKEKTKKKREKRRQPGEGCAWYRVEAHRMRRWDGVGRMGWAGRARGWAGLGVYSSYSRLMSNMMRVKYNQLKHGYCTKILVETSLIVIIIDI